MTDKPKPTPEACPYCNSESGYHWTKFLPWNMSKDSGYASVNGYQVCDNCKAGLKRRVK